MLLLGLLAMLVGSSATADEWGAYGRDARGSRYSPLMQVAPENVSKLREVWTYHTGDVADGSGNRERSGFETTPLMMDGNLYLTTPFNRVIALDAATGRERWVFDPKINQTLPYGDGLINRGLAAWRDGKSPAGRCALRLFEATLDARLVALDAATGRPCKDFGNGGEVDLSHVARYIAGRYHMTSPPVVLDGAVIVGSAIDDNMLAEMPDGVVRGFDARSGKLLWSWEPLERPAGVRESAWRTGAGNAWSIPSADPQRHLVYIPTGSASPDYYGGLRPGDNRWADSVVALEPRSGKLVWGFQLVHHDLWDYDTAASPLITSFELNGQNTPVLIAGNKTGMLYVLDPSSGKPVLPIEERPVPQSLIPGEVTSLTQPFPVTVPALVSQSLVPQSAWGISDSDRRACESVLKELTGTSIFSPPSLKGIAAVPGNVGGINWSGFAWDAKHERLIVAVTNLAFRVQLIPRDKFAAGNHGDFRAELAPQAGTPYAMARAPLRAPSGALCTPPPWGELVSVDLAAGKIAWRKPLGSLDEMFPGIGKRAPGSVVLGGPIVTASGLIFIAGTVDRQLHAISSDDGKELWTAALPASAHALPITYEVGGKQFVVVAAGGSAKITEEGQGDAVIAFALP
ncbi:MAG TPA: pyrroloquinoline quinone-dependent dehydrogenase [Steroidobacteraceae bacterium]|nr:pyrroloquinoline quinone-dependent dehydrogenase [Steroidobacteraceae bacterium]